ncbi:MAG: YybS family protein [Rectinema sp.]|nr:YybS family protein [Rectinema sp.]
MTNVKDGSDMTSTNTLRVQWRRSMAAGIVSGLFFTSGFLALACLVPVQYAFVREGKKEGFHSLLTALLVIGVGNALQLGSFGALNPSNFLQSLLMPALLLGSLAILHFIRTSGWIKLTAAWILLSVIFGFLLNASIGSASMQESIAVLVAQFIANTGLQPPETAILLQEYVQPAVAVVMNCFGMVIWFVLAGSWWLGKNIALRQKADNDRASLHSMVVPSWLLWPSMLSWALLLAVLYRHLHGFLSIVAWNASLTAAMWYALQGIGIITHFFRIRGIPRGAGIFLSFLVLLGLLDSKVGLAEMIVLPALGVTEVWSNYRTRKGA